MAGRRVLLGLRFFQRPRRAFLVFYYRNTLRSVGRNFRIGLGSTIVTPERVSIGDNFFCGPGTYISARSEVSIGNDVMLGPDVMILGGNHDFEQVGVRTRWAIPTGSTPPIVIEDDVWIGARAIVLEGVRIGTGTVIGAGSVVTHAIPAYSIAAGSPCRVLRPRFSRDDLERHRVLLGTPLD